MLCDLTLILKRLYLVKIECEREGSPRKNKGEHLRGSDQKDAKEIPELLCF